jgi:hypothetical protein
MTDKTSDTGSAALTRRNFLEQFGLVGGSTLVMSAMRSWDLMAQAGPVPSCLADRTAPRWSSSAPVSSGIGSRIRARQARLQRVVCSRHATGSEASTGRCAAGNAHGARTWRGNAGLQLR